MKAEPFFIFALPRSRTAWMSVLMTTDISFCYHEVSGDPDIDVIDDLKDKVLPEYLYTGFADTALAIWWRDIIRVFPKSPRLVIQRDPEQVIQEMMSIPQFKSWPERVHRQSVELIQEGLENLSHSPETLTMPFEQLSSEIPCEQAMTYLMPDVFFDSLRWEHLTHMNIQCNIDGLIKRLRGQKPGLLSRLLNKGDAPCRF